MYMYARCSLSVTLSHKVVGESEQWTTCAPTHQIH